MRRGAQRKNQPSYHNVVVCAATIEHLPECCRPLQYFEPERREGRLRVDASCQSRERQRRSATAGCCVCGGWRLGRCSRHDRKQRRLPDDPAQRVITGQHYSSIERRLHCCTLLRRDQRRHRPPTLREEVESERDRRHLCQRAIGKGVSPICILSQVCLHKRSSRSLRHCCVMCGVVLVAKRGCNVNHEHK